MGYIGMHGPKGDCLFAVLIINGGIDLVVLISDRMWFLHSCLEFG